MSIATSTQWLFFHLWKKNSKPHGVLIPDTIIYRWSQPIFLYGVNPEGVLIRKTKERINLAEYEKSLAVTKGRDIVSQTIYPSSKKEADKLMINPFSNSPKPQTEETNVFQFQTNETYRKALYNNAHRLTMIFQRFVYPRDDFVSTIRVEWSPYVCFMIKRTSLKRVDDVKTNLHERIATFESLQYLTKEELTSPLLTTDIQKLCENIANHIMNVSANNISVKKMTLYFRVDEEDQIQLLFASEIKLVGKNHGDLELVGNEENRLTLKKNLFRENIKQADETVGLKCDNSYYCINCERLTFHLYPLHFRQVVLASELGYVTKEMTAMSAEFLKIRSEVLKRREQRLKESMSAKKTFNTPEQQVKYLCDQLQMEQVEKKFKDLEDIPYLIIKAYGIISKDKYTRLRKNQSWLSFVCNVCDFCFMLYTQHVNHHTLRHKLKPQSPSSGGRPKIKKQMRRASILFRPFIPAMEPSGNKVRRGPAATGRRAQTKEQDRLSTKEEEEIIRQLKGETRMKFTHRRDYDPSDVYSKRSSRNKSQPFITEALSTISLLKAKFSQLLPP